MDGSGVGDVDPDVMREREALSRDGIVLVNLTMTKEFNAVVYEPDITTRGFILPREGDELLIDRPPRDHPGRRPRQWQRPPRGGRRRARLYLS